MSALCPTCEVAHRPTLGKDAAAKHCGMGRRAFNAAIANGNGPPMFWPSGAYPRFAISALDEWMRTPTARVMDGAA